MTFLHSADWHLGRLLHEQSLAEEQRHFLRWFALLCARENPDAVLLAGDIFDRSIPSEEAVNLWTAFLEDLRLRCPHLPLVVIAGNHDNPSRLEFASPILRAAGIHVAGRWSTLTRTGEAPRPVILTGVSGETAQIWPLPFLWPGALEVKEGEGKRPSGTQEESLAEGIRRIAASQDRSCLQVLVAHCFARGGQVSESERTLVGTATQVDSGVFSPFHYTALGHLHRPQEVSPGVWYSGSPLAYSFSEAPDQKVVLKVVVTPERPVQVVALEVPVTRPVKVIRGPLASLLTEDSYREYRESYLRVESTDNGGIAHPFHRLRQVFPYILSYEEIRESPTEGHKTASEQSSIMALGGRQRSLEEDFGDFLEDLNLPEEEKPGLLEAFRTLAAGMDTQGGVQE